MDLEEIEDHLDFAWYLKTTRAKYGITQTFLSQESGVTRAIISKIETGKAKNTFLTTAIKLLHVLNRGVFIQEVQKD